MRTVPFHIIAYLLPGILMLLPAGAGHPDNLQEAARFGDPRSQLKLGLDFLYGRGRQANPVLARYWLFQSAGRLPEGQYYLAYCYYRGIGGEARPNAAFHLLDNIRDQFPAALALYAQLLYAGIPAEKGDSGEWPAVPADKEGAIAMLRGKEHLDHSIRLTLIRFYYDNAPKYAIPLRQQLAKYCELTSEPDLEMLILYSACLRSGIGGDVDVPKGVKYLQKAADRHYPEALALLGEIYLDGLEVPRDFNRGWQYLMEARDKSPRAQVALGRLYLGGCAELPVNLPKALAFFQLAADKGYPPGLYYQGWCYRYGMGTSCRPQEAFKSFLAGSQANDADSMYQLGCCYEEGFGVRKNPDMARKCFQQAATQRHALALRKLNQE